MAFHRKFRSTQARQKYRKQIGLRIGLWFGVVVALGVLLWQVAVMPQINIHTVEVNGNEVVRESDITHVVAEHLDENYLWLFPKQNIFLLPKTAIEKELLEIYPRIAHVHISRNGLEKITVRVSERKTVALWCDEKCFLMDGDGLLFADSASLTSSRFVVFMGGITDTAHVRSHFLTPELFIALRDFAQSLETMQIQISHINVIDDYCELVSDTGLRIRVRLDADFDDMHENLATVLESTEFQSDVQTLSEIEYIDLRFGNKVFYTLQTGHSDTAVLEESNGIEQ